jgi:hypothetical protein
MNQMLQDGQLKMFPTMSCFGEAWTSSRVSITPFSSPRNHCHEASLSLPVHPCLSLPHWRGGQSSTQTSVLTKVADVRIPGPAVRFDYQTFDPASGQLYIAHMNADQLVVFDTSKRQIVASLDGLKRVHGVTVVPEIHRLYASVASCCFGIPIIACSKG